MWALASTFNLTIKYLDSACENVRMLVLLLLLGASTVLAGDLNFLVHTIEKELPSGYQVLAIDLNQDKRIDVIGLSQQSDILYWYENPGWQRHALVTGMHRMISLAASDLDGDGVPEIALGTHFGQTDQSSEGRVYLLRHNKDVKQLWKSREIDRLPTTHRLRFLDVDSDGVPELVNSPLTGPGCERPMFTCNTSLVYYEPQDWSRHDITQTLDGVVHGMRETDWDGPAILTACMGGVDRFQMDSDGKWSRLHILEGDPRERPLNGASEVRLGHGSGGQFLTTIEPWHGNQVAVYLSQENDTWNRTVIDDTLKDGHVLDVADFDGDGSQEIIAGMRGEPYGLYFYEQASDGWEKSILDDGGISAAGCDISDLDEDGDLDVVCIGAHTGNIRWYENTLPSAQQ